MFIVKIQLVSTKKFKIPKEKLIVKLIIRVCIFFSVIRQFIFVPPVRHLAHS